MPEITYDSIRPLVQDAEQDGATMRCRFACPASGAVVEATGPLRRGDGLADRARQSVKRSLSWSIRSKLLSAVRSVAGHGLFGRMVSDVAYRASSDAAHKATAHSFSEAEQQAGVVAAFESVRSQFAWDPANDRWISAQAAADTMTDFSRQLSTAPVSQRYDAGVLARMLVEIVRADGTIAEEERQFLAGFLPADAGSVEALAERPALSTAELAEAGAGAVRETMLMIAWGVALTDEELDAAEAQRLAAFAEGLGIGADRAAELKRYAQCFLLDQALDPAYPGGRRDDGAHAEAMALAGRIGLEPEQAERVDIRYRKRNGIV